MNAVENQKNAFFALVLEIFFVTLHPFSENPNHLMT